MPIIGDVNAVLAAQNLNPSIFTHIWLSEKGLFREKDFTDSGSMYTPVAVNVVTPDLAFVAIPERVQIGLISRKDDPNWFQDQLQRTLGVIATELHHTPFLAVGFNMDWVVTPGAKTSILELERKHFLNTANPLARHFDNLGCRFGFYLSKEFTMGRLKLDIKPVTLQKSLGKTEPGVSEGTRLLFNFHLDLTDNKPAQVLKFLNHWGEAYNTALSYVRDIETAWNR